MVAFVRRLLQRESCEWKYGKRCCTTIQPRVTAEPTDVVCRMQNTSNMFPNTHWTLWFGHKSGDDRI
jgi:hypothetical protein